MQVKNVKAIKKIIKSVFLGIIAAIVLLFFFPGLKKSSFFSSDNTLFIATPLSLNNAVIKASPAVVNIYSKHISENVEYNEGLTALGSGVIMNKNGYIITNLHVINGAELIIVALQDGRTYTATLVGSDSIVDIAVLKINANNLPTILVNLKRKPLVGDVVLAIGNPYNIGQTITQGIISATGRDGLSLYRRQNFIQTDAPINYGNSGGALVNSLGELVGINTLTFSKNNIDINDTPEGIGFAIPTSLVLKVMNTIIKYGEVVRGYIGIDGKEFYFTQTKNDAPVLLGVLITKVEGPAEKAGLLKNDIIISIDDKPVKSIIEAMNQIAELRPSDQVPIEILRNGQKYSFSVTIESLK